MGPDPLSQARSRLGKQSVTQPVSPNAALDYGVYYRVWHDDTDEHAAKMAAWHAESLAGFVPQDRTARCLDIGCGMGFTLLALQSLGFHDISGIDVDRSQIEAATRRGLSVEQVTDTIEYLQQRPSTYDLVVMLDVLEHIPVAEQVATLRSIRRALRPEGRVVIQVPNATSPLAARWRYNDFTHTSSFTEHSLAFVLANAGFCNVSIPVPPDPKFPWPPVRFWRRSQWIHFRNRLRIWFSRFLWRQICLAELGNGRGANSVPLSLNIIAVGHKRDGAAT